MNAITTTNTPSLDEVIRVLENSLYPGAKRESIELVLAYCRANGLDPMLKPVHIVPTNVKLPNGKYEWRDILMPGIADYRIKAARSGEYGGKSEPEFGPDVTATLNGTAVTYPSWCRITIQRIVQGQAREFSATERWLENYATAGRDDEAPNRMWKKRPYGQLAKCAESQALRMAFPEFSAGYTAEEMEGKTMDGFTGQTIDAEPSERSRIEPPPKTSNGKRHSIAPPKGAPDADWLACLEKVAPALAKLRTLALVEEMGNGPTCSDIVANGPQWAQKELAALLAENVRRFKPRENVVIENDPLTGEDDGSAAHEPELPDVQIEGERFLAAG